MWFLNPDNIKEFVSPLIELTTPSLSYPDILFNLPEPDPVTGRKYSRAEFYNKVYPVLAAIAPYSEYLESTSNSKVTRAIVTTLLSGLSAKKSARTCIVALTSCSLEMKKTMH